MKKILYGDSHFPRLMRDDALYVDKTPFLEMLENLGERYLVFLRPRRFGKSLWVSTLWHYYGMEHRQAFPELFGKLLVGKRPTPLANHYFVLFFEFTGIDTTTPESTFSDFMQNVQIGVDAFLSTYKSYFTAEQTKAILAQKSPNTMVKALFAACKKNALPYPIYLLIDEYDHFANELIAFRMPDFLNMVGRNGFVRKFYESLKTAAFNGVIERLFITGASPITLDSLTSGFNITTQLTTNLRFHDMMGFTIEQTADVLRNSAATEAQLPALMDDMKRWYDGYTFNPDATTKLFNSDMVLYFASEYGQTQKYPRKMLDSNIASDYGKIRQIFRIAGRENDNRNSLYEVLTEGHTLAVLTDQYSFEIGFTSDDFKSLLFYMGYLTVQDEVQGKLRLTIPNQVIRTLFWEYFAALTGEMTGNAVTYDHISPALDDLTFRNNPMPLLALVQRTLECLSNRDDMKLDEKHLKAIFVSYVSQTNAYYLKSEFETERKYVDLLMTGRPPFKVEHQFAFEFKHLHKKDAAKLESTRSAAHQQLRGYLEQEELKHLDNLRCWVILFVGTKLKVAEPLKEAPSLP